MFMRWHSAMTGGGIVDQVAAVNARNADTQGS